MGARMFLTNGTSPISAINFSYGTNSSVTVYYSMIMRVADITSLSTTGDYCFGFNNQQTIADQGNTPSVWAGKIWFKKVTSPTTGYVLGINKLSGTVGNATFDTTVHST